MVTLASDLLVVESRKVLSEDEYAELDAGTLPCIIELMKQLCNRA